MQERLRFTDELHRLRKGSGVVDQRIGIVRPLIERHTPWRGDAETAPAGGDADTRAVLVAVAAVLRRGAQPAVAAEKKFAHAHVARRPCRFAAPFARLLEAEQRRRLP